jgi:hypothetical protein
MFLEKISGYRIEKIMFLKRRGYPLNLKKPRTFCEKIVWKKLFDRNPLITLTADKYKVRTYIEQRLGKEKAKEALIPLLYVTGNPEKIPFDDLPESYIIKANHSSGWNIIINGKEIDRNEIISTCKKWLKRCYGLDKNEWAYKNIKRRIVIEKLLKNGDGKIPEDYKFFIFHGVCRKVMVFFDRYSGRSASSYNRDWNFLPQSNPDRQGLNIEKPKTYEKMLAIAEGLGEDFDFVRVDLYTIGEKVYFGEFTHYPQSGVNLKIPLAKDIETGKYWDIEKNKYWNGKKPDDY